MTMSYWLHNFFLNSMPTALTPKPTPTIFEEFKQVKDSDREHKGTGLGLLITKGFAEFLGRLISVEREVGKGSAFTVNIPLIF